MDRSLTNAIRFVMDECLPPLLRDSRWFMRPFYQVAYRGKNVEQAMDFKSLVHEWSQQEYDSFYASLDTISRNRLTDLNRPSLEMVLREVDPGASTLLDVGCANGHLLRQIGRRHPHLALTGLDVRPDLPAAPFTYVRGHAEDLPFEDDAFDVVTCSHTIEHVLDVRRAVAELKRVARRQLIVVTPRQRYFYYTLDEHVNFFPSAVSLTGSWTCPTTRSARSAATGCSSDASRRPLRSFRGAQCLLRPWRGLSPTAARPAARRSTAPRSRGPSRVARVG